MGMAYVVDNYPLYYDGFNEEGLCIAALLFPDYACYNPTKNCQNKISPYEFIPWILSQCSSISQVKELLSDTSLTAIPFNKKLPLSPLHWMISHKGNSIVVEPREHGLKIYDNPVHVLTNSPPFSFHLNYLSHFFNLSNQPIESSFFGNSNLKTYSNGMGGMGLPGDLSSSSRFVKAAFTNYYSHSGSTEEERISQFFHILGSVEQQRGCVCLENKLFEITQYSCCCNATKGIYYYKTYDNSQISAVYLHKTDLDSHILSSYPLDKHLTIHAIN